MDKKCENWWDSVLHDGTTGQRQRMMKSLEQAFRYTQYMVNAADQINRHRRYKVQTISSFLCFSWMGYAELSNRDLYLLFQEQNAPFDDYWMMVTTDWTSTEWAEFVKLNSAWEGQNE